MTASKAISMARDYNKFFRVCSVQGLNTPVIAVIDSLAEDMQHRFHTIEHFRLLSKATLLDPRCKQRAFHDAAADEASENISANPSRIRTAIFNLGGFWWKSGWCSQHHKPNIYCSAEKRSVFCKNSDSKSRRPTGLVESKASSIRRVDCYYEKEIGV